MALEGDRPNGIDDILYDQDFGGGEVEHGRGEGGIEDMGGAGEFFFDDVSDTISFNQRCRHISQILCSLSMKVELTPISRAVKGMQICPGILPL